ncbi:MAG: carboxypeptidase-like regulatory domain-containing protein, partial [Planctomycetota bacterium]
EPVSQGGFIDVLRCRFDDGPKVAIQNLGPGEERLLRIHQSARCLGLAAKVTLEKGPKRLTLAPCTTISGRLLDEAGAPVGGVEVQVETGIDFDGATTTQTDAAGRFRIEHVVPGVEYRISGRSEKLLDEYRLLVENPTLAGGVLDLGELVVPLR